VNPDKREVTAYASVFGVKDRIDDIVHPGAFKMTLQRGPMSEGKCAYKYNHQDLIGKPIHAVEDTKGLLTVARVSKTPLGDEKLELMRDTSLNTYSFKYATVKGKVDFSDDGTRNLREVKLFEFGPVDPDLACNPEAMVLGVKTVGDCSYYSIYDYIDVLSSYLRGLQAKDRLTPSELTMLNTAYDSIMASMDNMKSLRDQNIDPSTLLESASTSSQRTIQTSAANLSAAVKSLDVDSVIAPLLRESAMRGLQQAVRTFGNIAAR
jgi:HK97 family phage prohead protease